MCEVVKPLAKIPLAYIAKPLARNIHPFKRNPLPNYPT
jgi:hypothetical protein